MLEKQPLVSVGIPTYNRPKGLRNTLDNILVQTYQNIEIIVSDNCSTDIETSFVIEEYQHNYPNIKFFRQDTNIGGMANLEFVLSKAKGKYFMWAADDDLCEPEMVSVLTTKMEENHNAVLCGSDVSVIDVNDTQIRTEHLKELYSGIKWDRVRSLFFTYPISNIFFVVYGLYETEILRDSVSFMKPGCRRYLTNSEVPFLAKISTLGEIIAVPEVLKFYRSHNDSTYYREISNISKTDRFFLRLLIRQKLVCIAISADIPVCDRFVLLKTIAASWIIQSIRCFTTFVVPKKLKVIIKRFINK